MKPFLWFVFHALSSLHELMLQSINSFHSKIRGFFLKEISNYPSHLHTFCCNIHFHNQRFEQVITAICNPTQDLILGELGGVLAPPGLAVAPSRFIPKWKGPIDPKQKVNMQWHHSKILLICLNFQKKIPLAFKMFWIKSCNVFMPWWYFYSLVQSMVQSCLVRGLKQRIDLCT